MNTSTLYMVVCCMGLQFFAASAQGTYQFGGLPSLNINRKLPDDWSVNLKAESRSQLQGGTFNEQVPEENAMYLLTDLSVIGSKSVGLNSRVSAGYLIRLRNGTPIHRAIQQYAMTRRKTGYRLSHRFVSDQTFVAKEQPRFRARYRLTTELPLNGQSVDVKEFYVKVSNEYLGSKQHDEYDVEIRLVPLLGYALAANHQLEAGLDYRISSFIDNVPRHSFWMSLNWYIEI